jgi:hypothetical protein
MGICLKDVELLIRLREGGYLGDRASIIEIGAQQISNSVLRNSPQVERLGRLFGTQDAPMRRSTSTAVRAASRSTSISRVSRPNSSASIIW